MMRNRIMDALIISALTEGPGDVEVVERKGLGHPDTICDALAENLSRNLCLAYEEHAGRILHHNVDKALLSGGVSAPRFGGGAVLAPIHIYLAGRATEQFEGKKIPVRDIALESSKEWLRGNLHAMDVDRHVVVHELLHPGSPDLVSVFAGSGRGVPLSNDTSIGVGYFPLSSLEKLVLDIESRINGRARSVFRPAWGEDVKVMGVRRGLEVNITLACAMIDRFIPDFPAYLGEKQELEAFVSKIVASHGFDHGVVSVNHGDSLESGSVYLTVTGTSAEAGDDGQVGRGNRINGLITPYRSMSLEAAAGKNPVTHVGKIYNVVAEEIAKELVAGFDVRAAKCVLVSRIGAPVTEPAIIHVSLTDASRVGRGKIASIVADRLSRIPDLIRKFNAGEVRVF